jgi:monoamine oxidase
MDLAKISRRSDLASAPASATVAADAPASRVSAMPQRPDVVVIGGGIAGLAAARRLKREGASVVVLEARDRLGGRIHTQPLARGGVIDLGAQFIGDAQRRISTLVDEAGLTRVKPHQDGDSLYRAAAGGKQKPQRFAEGALPLSWLGQLDAFQATQRLGRRALTDPAERARLDAITASAFIAEQTFTRATNTFLLGHLESECCAAGDEISALEMLDQLSSVGGFAGEQASAQWYLAEGTGPLIDHLAGDVGTSIALNAPVIGLAQQSDRMVVETPQGALAASQVVVAVPPQFYGRMRLTPWFSAPQQKVLSEYRLGSVIKTMLVFATPWWRELGLSGRAGSAGGLFNAMVDASPADGSAGVLVLFSTGPSGRRLAATRSEALRIALALEDLRTLAVKTPAPLFARSVDWNNDPWSLGGYASRRGLGGWVQAPDLFQSRGCFHFAGTETADEWRSFMEGALQSAERAADAALQALQRPSPAAPPRAA